MERGCSDVGREFGVFGVLFFYLNEWAVEGGELGVFSYGVAFFGMGEFNFHDRICKFIV